MFALSVSDSGLGVYRFDEEGKPEQVLAKAEVELAQWSEDGSRLVTVQSKPEPAICIYDKDLELVSTFKPTTSKIVRIKLSPKGNFAAICGRYEAGDPRNFRIISLSTGEVLINHSLGNYVDSFPPCQWSSNETFLAYQLTGKGVDIFRMADANIGPGNAAWLTIEHEGMCSFLIGKERGASCTVATASKKLKGKPAAVKVVDLFAPNATIASTSFFNCDSVRLMLNYNGKARFHLTCRHEFDGCCSRAGGC